MTRRPVSQLPLASTRSQAELQLSLLHNLLLRFALRAPETLYRPPSLRPSFSVFPKMTNADRLPRLSREDARVGLIKVADQLAEAKARLTDDWDAFEAEFAGVNEDDSKRRDKYLALGRAERELVEKEYADVAKVLDRRQFNAMYCRMGSRLVEQLERTAHVDQAAVESMRHTLGVDRESVKGGERAVEASDKVTNLLKKLVEALVIFRSAQDTARLSASTPLNDTPTHAENQLPALARLVLDFAATCPDRIYVRGNEVTKREARDALRLISCEVDDSANELRAEWEAFHLKWDLLSSQNSTRLKENDLQSEAERKRVQKAFEFVAKSVDRTAFCDEYLSEANALLDRFNSEPALDSHAREEFRTMIGLRKFKRLTEEEEIKADRSTVDLLKILVHLQAIDAKLPSRPALKTFAKVLRQVQSMGQLNRPSAIETRAEQSARELGAGAVWRAEGRGRFGTSARKASMYAI